MQALAATSRERSATFGPRFVLAFDDEASENPLRRALLAAQALMSRFCSRSLVDLAQVTVMQRKQGSA